MKTETENSAKKRFGIAIAMMIFLFSFFPYANAKADYWGAAMMSEVWAAAYNKMMKQIDDTLVASLQQAAYQTISNAYNNAISGASGPMFITNWENFLISDPQRKADLYMNDFFTSMTSGRGSAGYSNAKKFLSTRNGLSSEEKVAGAETAREGIVAGDYAWSISSGSYQVALVEEAKNNTINASIPACEITDASGAFTGNSWSTFTTMIGTDSCNKFGFNNISQSAYASKLEKEGKIAETQGLAGQGFLPKMSGNTIITPGSTIASIQAQIEDLPNKVIAAADSAPEIITSIVTRLATRTIQQGIGQAQQYAQREINNQVNGVAQQIRNQTDPRKIFKSSY